MPIFIQRAQHQHIHVINRMHTCKVLTPPFVTAAIGCRLWRWQDCISVNIKTDKQEVMKHGQSAGQENRAGEGNVPAGAEVG